MMLKTKSIISFLIILLPVLLVAQENDVIPLWENIIVDTLVDSNKEKIRVYEPTGDHVVTNVHHPSITAFIPSKEKSTGVAVIIAPGGGHVELWIDHEGYNIARKLKEQGIAAFVLKYRLARAEDSKYTVEEHSVKDMQQAVKVVRSKAAEWNIETNKIGVMGFSAGAEVAAVTDMLSQNQNDSKPNFHGLIYPGNSQKFIPTEKSSPVFILAGYHDRDDISKGMTSLYLKYKELNIPADLHIYSNIGHGFGMRKGDTGAASKWLDRMVDWMNEINFK